MSCDPLPGRGVPRITTARLVLDLPTPQRAASVAAYYDRNRAHLQPWDPVRPVGFYREDYWQDRLLAHRLEGSAGQHYRWWLSPPGRPDEIIGAIGLSNVVHGVFCAAHLGYSIDEGWQGRGLMGEAVEAVCQHAFHRLHLHRVMANYMPRNVRSGRLLRRLGFQVEGYARDYLRIAGRWEDHILTARLSPRAAPATPLVG